MSDQHSDFERLVGPDRRPLKRPRGLAAWISGIAVLVLIGLLALWPTDPPDLDLAQFGFAEDAVLAEVTHSRGATTIECRLGWEPRHCHPRVSR